jgi:glycosyltransferase involved in cell wall biosynthesis
MVKMKILTGNASGIDIFGGIHTQLQEHIKHSPEYHFYIVEPNKEKKYISRNNKTILTLDFPDLIGANNLLEVLRTSETIHQFNRRVEPVVNEYQNIIQYIAPDALIIFGSSLSSLFLYKAARREGALERTIHVYSGVLEKEIGDYRGEPRELLRRLGKTFTEDVALENVTYIFPSELCKRTVERIHGVRIENSYIIPNGISEEFCIDTTERNPPKELTLGYVGRLTHVKNPGFFLNLGDNVSESIKLKIITDIRFREIRGSKKLLLEKLNAGEVFYYAPRDKLDLSRFYRTQVSAIVVPSLFETFCNVAVESLVCGTPVLLSDRAGAREILEKHNLEDLVFSITEMDSFNRALRAAQEREFRIPPEISQKIYQELSWRKIIEKYNQIIEAIGS